MLTARSFIKKTLTRNKFIYSCYLKVAFATGFRKKTLVLDFTDIATMVDDWCHYLPTDIDCVIGVPRGGLVVANMIALNFGVSLSTPDCFLRGEVWQSFSLNKTKDFKRVLVVEDWVSSGNAIISAVKRLEAVFPDCKFILASLVLGYPPGGYHFERKIDHIYCVSLEVPREIIHRWDVCKNDIRFDCLFYP